jgi:hypothetical protein
LNDLVWYIMDDGIPSGETYDLFTTANEEMTVLEFYVPSSGWLPGYAPESVGPVSCQPLYHYPFGGSLGPTQCESEFDFYGGLYGNGSSRHSD